MSEDDRLEGELLSFSFRAADSGFAVGRLRTEGGGEIVVVGALAHLTEGQHVSLEGRYTEHQSFGRQFKVARFLVDDPRTKAGLERYLSSGAVHGLGPEFARRVVEKFGLDTLRILEHEPERLREVKGIGPKRLAEIAAHWERDLANRELHVMLRGYGLGPAVVSRVIERFGRDALSAVTRDPYSLASEIKGVGFRTADTIARGLGVAPEDPRRAEAAALYLLGAAEDEGHCFLPEAELLDRGLDLELRREDLADALDRLATQGRVVRDAAADPTRRPVYTPRLERAEVRVAKRLIRLCESVRRSPALPMAEAEAALGIALNADQRRAVTEALSHGVSVITGGPGTGKTTIVRVLAHLADTLGQRWLLAAPTGRAARRLTEATGQEAKTLHRLLEYTVRLHRFAKTADSPLEADGVLVDEASMVDLPLMDSLLAALPAGCRLVLVGDADQLPSVGPGRVLGDLIASGVLPVATLAEVYRQAADSGIVRNAHRVNQGIPPISREREPAGEEPLRQDFFVLERNEPEEVLETLLEVVRNRLRRLGFDPMRDVQVLTPMHGGQLGTEALNTALQDALNPPAARGPLFTTVQGAEWVRRGRRLRVGDRVIQARNNYDLDIFNGDTGRIVGVEDAALEVDFDGRPLGLAGESLEDIELAWAISIHKSQGSEYPAVVVVLHRSHRVMLRRNLIYTAITRARRFCCVIGDRWALETAARQRGGDERWTRLGDRLGEEGG